MNGTELRAVGVTERQVSYWTARGYLRPLDANPGSGRPLEFSDREIRIAQLIVKLTRAGIRTADAAYIARNPRPGATILRRLLADIEALETS